MKIGAVVQTRMGSTRLPGKVMLDIYGKPVIQHVIERLKQSKYLDEIIIATTTHTQDDVIVEQARKNSVKWFRGSEEDVLSRYYYAAKENNLDIVVRITSDCPLIDPFVIDEMIDFYKKNNYLMVTNAGTDLSQRTYPRGLDVEIFCFEVLQDAFHNASENYQREHVTPYIYETSNKIYYYKNTIDYSKYRWTLDTEEDFELITVIYKCLYRRKHDFYLNDIIKLLEQNPAYTKINAHVEQKKI
jgi:spore coat polysaccharide biosynthesis protein SpsF